MSGRWDNKNTDQKFSSRKVILVLIGVMVSMWVLLGTITFFTPISNTDCETIIEFTKSSEFYDLEPEVRESYYNLLEHCDVGVINVK